MVLAPPGATLTQTHTEFRLDELAGPHLQRGVEAGEPFALHMLWWVLACHPMTGGYAGIPPDPFHARAHCYAVWLAVDGHTQGAMRWWLLAGVMAAAVCDRQRA